MHTSFYWPDYLLWFGACCLTLFELLLDKAKHEQSLNSFASKHLAGIRTWFLLWVIFTCITPGWRYYGAAIIAATIVDIIRANLELFDPSEELPFDSKVARVALLIAIFCQVP